MLCDKCNTDWCYMCGKAEKDLDKEDPNANIYSHNANWSDHVESRCPMYLTEIQDYDKNWKDNEEECLNRFHRIKTI